jgi:predicted deacylase
MKRFRTFLKEEADSVETYFAEFANAVSSTHRRIDENGHTFFVPIDIDENKPKKMIAAALQGDEPAGWLGLLKFVKENKPDHVNVSYLPIVSKEVFRSGKHEDDANQNPNNNIPEAPSREMSRLLAIIDKWLPLARDGFVDLHEDPYRAVGYMYVWSDRGDLGDRMVNIVRSKFPLFDAPIHMAKDGRIEVDEQGMLGDYLSKLNISPSMTTETPAGGEFPIDERVEVQVELVKEFLK